jgi:insulysin
MLSSIIK